MIKTTRIKYSQAPRIIVDDLSPQCDGVKQTFTLSRPVPEWAPYCLVFNGQLYTNTSYKQWFVLDADRKTIHTSFITPPTQGPNKSLILIVGVAGMEDLGVTWDDIVNKPEIPTEEEVDAKDAAVLEDAKEYADSIVPTVDVTKAYVDAQDAVTLQAAKDYTDEHGGGGSETELFFITATSIDDTNHTFTTDKTYAEALEAYTAGKLLVLKYVSLGADDGEYTFIPLSYYIDFDEGTGFMFQSSHTDGREGRVHASNEDFFLSRYSNQNTYYHGSGTVEVDSVLDVYATSSHTISNSAVATALQAKANSADLAAVATSGSYADLTNKPSIPVFTVSNVDIQEGSALPANNFYGVYIDEESE